MIKFITFTDPNSISPKNPNGEKKQFPIRISYYALKMLKEDLGRGLSIADDGTDYQAYETLLFYALKKGHQKAYPGKEFTLEKVHMEDIMDECYKEFMRLVPEFFSDEELTKEETTTVKRTKGKEGEKK